MNLFVEITKCDDCNGIRDLCDEHSQKALQQAINDKPA